jgi:hypothetical protein
MTDFQPAVTKLGKNLINNILLSEEETNWREKKGGTRCFPPETETNGQSFQLHYKKRKVKPFPTASPGEAIYSALGGGRGGGEGGG